MEDIEQIKKQILELHKAWDTIPDDGDSLDGFKDAESIESEVQDLILCYCEKKEYSANDLTVEHLKELSDEDIDELFPENGFLDYLEQLALKHDDVAELLWFYYHTFWPEVEMWGDVEAFVKFLKDN